MTELSPRACLGALAGASALVVVAQALAMRRFAGRLGAAGDFDAVGRAAFLRRVRWVGSIASILQLVILLFAANSVPASSWKIRGPILLCFFAAILLQAGARFAVEKRLRGVRATPREHMFFQLRVIAVSFLRPLIAIVLVGFLIVVYENFVRAHAPDVSWAWRLLLAFAGPAAIIAGVSFLFLLLSPRIVRLMLPCEPVTDPTLQGIVERCFVRAGLKAPDAWLLGLDRFGGHTAMITGLKTVVAWAKPGVFFTRSLFERLAPAEFEAILLHEVSHVSLRHLSKRTAFSLLAAAAAGGVVCAAAAAVGIDGILRPPRFVFGYVVIVVVQVIVVRLLVRYQEMDADSHAVISLGADAAAMESGLRKLIGFNDLSTTAHDPTTYLSSNAGHPVLEARVTELRRRVQRSRAGLPDDTRWLPLRDLLGGRAKYAALALTAAAGGLAWNYFRHVRPAHELVAAARRGDIVQVRGLLARGADPNMSDPFNRFKTTPLIAAAKQGKAETVAVLLAAGAAPDRVDGSRLTPLMWAVMLGHRDCAAALLDGGASPNASPENPGLVPLITAAVASPIGAAPYPSGMVELLISRGAAVDARNSGGITALGAASALHKKDVVALLKKAGARDLGRPYSPDSDDDD